MTDWSKSPAPDAAAIETMARAVLAEFPAAFAKPAAEVHLRVDELADEAMLDELQTDDPFEVTGIYDGIPMTEKTPDAPQYFPDVVYLYRRAILAEWVDRGDVTLGDLVRNVVVHEFAHHFGWSDEDIAKIDRWWE